VTLGEAVGDGVWVGEREGAGEAAGERAAEGALGVLSETPVEVSLAERNSSDGAVSEASMPAEQAETRRNAEARTNR
jgi:hypothetical protein